MLDVNGRTDEDKVCRVKLKQTQSERSRDSELLIINIMKTLEKNDTHKNIENK
jgi:hypothetical protein